MCATIQWMHESRAVLVGASVNWFWIGVMPCAATGSASVQSIIMRAAQSSNSSSLEVDAYCGKPSGKMYKEDGHQNVVNLIPKFLQWI
ncbi:hypothetical protein BC832DRAFT_563543 [Gaertneriomyces semiglobifer]|nr:hypothetical protein BC832DRAFT_563543 [Gaertneriomyces semiglobifer]